MNSYLNLLLDAEAAKQRLHKLFQSAPEPEKNDQLLAESLAAIRSVSLSIPLIGQSHAS